MTTRARILFEVAGTVKDITVSGVRVSHQRWPDGSAIVTVRDAGGLPLRTLNFRCCHLVDVDQTGEFEDWGRPL